MITKVDSAAMTSLFGPQRDMARLTQSRNSFKSQKQTQMHTDALVSLHYVFLLTRGEFKSFVTHFTDDVKAV